MLTVVFNHDGGGMADQLAERRYDLDWVRIGAFLLLILYHTACTT